MNRTNEEKWKKIGKVALITGSVITGIALIPITIDTQEMFNLQKQETLIINGKISDDCNIFMTTDMTSIKFWEFESHKNIGYITKEKFDSFSINFYHLYDCIIALNNCNFP